ncbi:MAG: DUF424 family protein [Candidatus Pacearchaeota archaeon]|nr:DUF424 family protein [Nanoarchaeota archaeon]MDZ4226571.1 DUF424 family protein [Candidatus Pacearchaeota archaeon]
MFIKVIKSYRDIVAICDSSILGKKFEQGKFQLDVKESFYRGEMVSEEKAIEIMKKMAAEDATFNIAGEKSVNAAIKAGVISKESIGKVQGIPFALVLL